MYKHKQILAFICLLFSLPVYAACEISDDFGNKLQLEKPARRIISLAPDLTETLFAIGASNQLVGVIDGSDYPEAAKATQRIGSYSGIDLEKMMTLHPDLIVNWGNNFSRQLTTLGKMSMPIYHSDPHHLEDIARRIQHLGCLTGNEIAANKLAENFIQQLNNLKQRYANKKPVTVFYQIGSHSLITINKDSWINQVIILCGGRNLFAEVKTIAPEITWEAVVVANPQVIINSTTDADWKTPWQAWQKMDAVKNNSLYSIHPDLLERAGPRLIAGAAELCKDLDIVRAQPKKES